MIHQSNDVCRIRFGGGPIGVFKSYGLVDLGSSLQMLQAGQMDLRATLMKFSTIKVLKSQV